MGYMSFVVVEGDNIMVIKVFRKKQGYYGLLYILFRTHIILGLCNNVKIRYIFREGNKAADWTVNVGYVYSRKVEMIILLFLEFDYILKADILGMLFERRVF